jgi:hypothetical protein
MMRHVVAVLSIVTCLSIAGTADAAETKQPWEWTSQERAQARRDPVKRLERLQAEDVERRASRISAKSVPAVADVINGAKHPELYFPAELFEYLVRYSFATLPAIYPQVTRQRSSDLFRNIADWNRFSVIVADYAKILKEEQNAANALDKGAVSAMQSRKCAAEARAFREARSTFGKARFDRMLYETVPVSMKTSFSIDTDFETSIGSALEREKRCQ